MKLLWKNLNDGTHEAKVHGLTLVVDDSLLDVSVLAMRIGRTYVDIDYYSRLDAAKRGGKRLLRRLLEDLNDDFTAERLSNQVVKHCEFVAQMTGKTCPMNLHEAADAMAAWAYEMGADNRQTTMGVYLCREHESLYFARRGCHICAAELEMAGDEV